jgi:hypothetical protein
METTPRRKLKTYIIVLVAIFVCAGISLVASRMLIEIRILRPNIFTGWLVSPSKWISTWLENPTCKVPCWEKIVSGKTSRDQAKSLLSIKPKIKSINDEDVIPYGLMLFIKAYNGRYNDKYYSSVSIKFDDQNIDQEISLGTFGENLYLDDLLPVYGAPKQVLIHDSPDNESVLVDMLYPELGMVASLFIHNKGGEIPQVEIEKYSEVLDIYLDEPGLQYYLHFSEIINGAIDPMLLSDWKGYTTYP